MYRELKIEEWNRKAIYSYYRQFEDPFFSICTSIDVKGLVDYCQNHKVSFHKAFLFYVCSTANEKETFRLRILNNKVVSYKKLDISAPVLDKDDTLSFCVFDFKPTLKEFLECACIKEAQFLNQQMLDTNEDKLDLLHTTSLPWHSFTAFKHPKRLGKEDSVPKVAWGKYMQTATEIMLPISIEVNHALMDGIHVAEYITLLQRKLHQMKN